MHDSPARHRDTLAFLASGLVHRIGNVLFTIQGHAQLARERSDRDPIASAARSGTHALAIVRTLLGPVNEPPTDSGELLETIVDLLRIPAREAEHIIELVEREGPAAHVDASAFCPAVIETVRLLLASLAAGQGGTIRIGLVAAAGEALRVRVEHSPTVGELPFPLALDELRTELRGRLLGWPGRTAVGGANSMVELSFGPTDRTAEGTAQA